MHKPLIEMQSAILIQKIANVLQPSEDDLNLSKWDRNLGNDLSAVESLGDEISTMINLITACRIDN